jgi:hypothetical protein
VELDFSAWLCRCPFTCSSGVGKGLNNMCVYIYFAKLAHATRALWSACKSHENIRSHIRIWHFKYSELQKYWDSDTCLAVLAPALWISNGTMGKLWPWSFSSKMCISIRVGVFKFKTFGEIEQYWAAASKFDVWQNGTIQSKVSKTLPNVLFGATLKFGLWRNVDEHLILQWDCESLLA